MSELILIIDDAPEMVRMLSAVLQGEGDILFALNGEAGLRLVRERRPALVLLDVHMAGMDGYEVCRRLKADPAGAETAVIFVTANHSMECEVQALEAGAADFVTKPLNPPVVVARVRTQLRLWRQRKALAELACSDGLTGLYNRRHFDDQAGGEFARHQRQGLSLGLLMIDIDAFKPYNDHYGHQGGDACLVAVAQALKRVARRPGELVARYGGEEFVVVLPNSTAVQVAEFGELLRDAVKQLALPHMAQQTGPVVSVSVGGAAMAPQAGDTLERLLAAADAALYRAKQAGRDRVIM
ncbi:diguanylate cyclase domain-containing protein [Pseudoduganella aquatica]|uniref:diguanylate cyclase domain-containing protein n=1 Tax=Pseudoduganella aquatica TaxID=2660641 RepID=UPI001E2DEFBF|nr:diguanylate cyclase [Pseudoduganella aquatica]